MPNEKAAAAAQAAADRQQQMELARAISQGDEDRAAMGRLQLKQAADLVAILAILNDNVLPTLARIEAKP
jgi:hypothetical protein